MSGQSGEDKLYHPRISEHGASDESHARETDKHAHSTEHGRDAHTHHHQVQEEHVHRADSLRDPVCGMTVTDASRFRCEHHARWYTFCSEACLAKFQAAPSKYVEPSTTEQPQAVPGGTLYTCPMHPEIRQDHPGQCPKCGMTLEPILPSVDEGENPELVDFRRRFWWTLPLTIVVFVLAMFGHRFELMDVRSESWVEFILSTPVVLWAGLRFSRDARVRS